VGWAVAVGGWAQLDPWASAPLPDPLRMASLPLDPAQAVIPPRGVWQISLAGAYFNVMHSTWHAAAIHREFGLQRQPFEPWEVATLAFRHAADQFYFVDLEGVQTELRIHAGLGGGFAVALSIPWVEVGAPNWDAIPEDFHERFGLSSVRRRPFPRGQSIVVVRGADGMVERFEDIVGSGLGDASVAVTGRLGSWLGGEQQWVVAVEAPTGERDTVWGSGGWDAGLRWFGTWGGERRQVRFGLGYTWLDGAGSWLGVHRSNTWHAVAEAHVPLGPLIARCLVRLDSSPLSGFTSSETGNPALYWTLGVLGDLAREAWWAFDVGENFPSLAEGPDFSFHVLFGTRL
jgi:hypothetical protein